MTSIRITSCPVLNSTLWLQPHLIPLEVCKAEVRLDNANVTEPLLGVLGGNRRRDNDVITREPVDGGSDGVLVGGLEGVDDTEDLSSVTAGGGGVGQDGTDLLVGVDDENGADGESDALGVDVGGILVVNHVVQVGDLALRVGDDGESELGSGYLVDVLDPSVVGFDIVGAQANELDAASSELRLELSESTELGGANGGEVIRVREQDGPAVANEFVESNRTVGGLSSEVGGSRAKAKRSTFLSHCEGLERLKARSDREERSE